MLKSLTLLRERIKNWEAYPFCIPAVRNLSTLDISSRVTFLVGENGTGKSTLLEAIAAHYGFGREGGNRNFRGSTTDSNFSVDPLLKALRLSFDIRTGHGFFFRAETFFNAATFIDASGLQEHYGGRSLHSRSHGETSLTLFETKFQNDGLFLMDEPEAALSPQRQLSLLVLIHDSLRRRKKSQFIVATHSPILTALPGAEILSFDGGRIHPIDYEQIPAVQISKRFLTDRPAFLTRLLEDEPPLFSNANSASPSQSRKQLRRARKPDS